MSPIIIASIIMGVTVVCFFHPKIPIVPVAFASGFAFVLAGILPASTMFNSFTSNTTMLLMGMMTIGGALFSSGLAGWIAKKIMGLPGTKKYQIQLAVLLTTFCIAPFLTGITTLMIMYPIICIIAFSTKTSMSDLIFYQMAGSMSGSVFTFTGGGMIPATAAILEASGYRIWGFFEIAYWGIPSKILFFILVYFLADRFILKGYPFKEPDNVAAVAEPNDLPEKFTLKMGVVAFILIAVIAGFIINNPTLTPAICAIMGALACLFTGILTPKQMYVAINWDTIILIGGMTAFSQGIGLSGLSKLIAESILRLTGMNSSPILIIFIILIVSSLVSQFMSDTAASTLMAPIAITLAVAQGVNVHAYVSAALFGSMLCHLTILSTPSFAFCQQLGGYDNKFFLKYGLLLELPANLIAAIIVILIVYL